MEFTERNRLPLPDQGDLGRLWGVLGINKGISLIDQALDNITLVSEMQVVSPNVYRLQMANGSTDTQRMGIIYFDSPVLMDFEPVTLIVPQVSAVYRFAYSALSSETPVTILQEGSGASIRLPNVLGSAPFGNVIYHIVATENELYIDGGEKKNSLLVLEPPSAAPTFSTLDGKIVLFNNYPGSVNVTVPEPSTLPDGFEVTFTAIGGNPALRSITFPRANMIFCNGVAATLQSQVSWNTITLRVGTSLETPTGKKYLVMRDSTVNTFA